MEPATVKPRPAAVSSLLGVPGSIAWDGDENKDAEVINGIRPKLSPLPRRRSDGDLDDCEFELPRSSSRRVSFADAIGLHLVRVKEFDSWDKSPPVNFDSLEGEKYVEEYYLSSLYTPPPSEEALLLQVQEQKLELESVELLWGTTTIRGVIRVLNISFDKTVYIRTSLDAWATHFDLLAEYILGSSHRNTDAFSFKLTLVPPFGENGARVDFCLRYETPVGTFWANNSNQNYVMFCHQKKKELKENHQKDTKGRRKSILKVSQEVPFDENQSSNNVESTDVHIDGGEMVQVNICDTHRGAIQQSPQKLIVESSWNSSGRKQRKATHMAQVRDYFTHRVDGTQKKGTVTVEPSQAPREGTFPQESPQNRPEGQPLPPQRRKRSGQQGTSYSLTMCNEPSFGVQDSTYWEESVKHENSTISSPLSEWNSEQALLIQRSQSDLNDQPVASSQNGDKSVCNIESSNLMQLEMEKGGCVNSTGSTHVRLENSIANPVLGSQDTCYTFGNVVAPLYHQVFGRVESERQNLTHSKNQSRDRLHEGDLTAYRNPSYPSGEEETQSRVLTAACGTAEEKPVDEQQSLESKLEDNTPGLNTEKESEPKSLSEETGGLSRTHTAKNRAAAVSISNEDLGLQGSEEKMLYFQTQIQQDCKIFQTQHLLPETPLDTKISHKRKTSNTTIFQTKTLIDATQGKLLQSQKEMGSNVISAELTLKGASGGYDKLADSDVPSANMDEWSTGNQTVADADLKVLFTNTEVCERIPTENLNFAKPFLGKVEGDTIRKALKEDPIVVNEWELENLIRKTADPVRDEPGKSLFYNANIHCFDDEDSEGVGGITNAHCNIDIHKVSKSKENEPVIRKKDEDLVCTENENDANDGLLVMNITEKDWEETLQEEEQEIMERCVQEGTWEEEKIIGKKELEEKEMEDVMLTKEGMKDLEEDMKWIKQDYGRTDKTKREEKVLGEKEAEAELEEIVVDIQNKLVDNLCMQMDSGNKDADGQIKLENVPETSGQGKHTLTVNEVSGPFHNKSINDVTLHEKSPRDEELDFIQESCLQTDEPANEEEVDGEENNTSTESLSDDELELYMHSLREAQKQQNKDFGLCLGKQSSISKRASRLSMPSISETVDDNDLSNKDYLPDSRCTSTLPLVAGGHDSTRSNGICWKETFSWHNLSRGLLYTVLLVVFFLLAYHYDFLACFGLYLLSVIWLFCQGEKQSLRRNNKII